MEARRRSQAHRATEVPQREALPQVAHLQREVPKQEALQPVALQPVAHPQPEVPQREVLPQAAPQPAALQPVVPRRALPFRQPGALTYQPPPRAAPAPRR